LISFMLMIFVGSYGSLARFYVMERLKQIGDFTVVGGGGDYSDFQHTIKNLEELVYVPLKVFDHNSLHSLVSSSPTYILPYTTKRNDDFCRNDGSRLYPEEIYNYLCRVQYNRRYEEGMKEKERREERFNALILFPREHYSILNLN
jgi:20S proteasome subunit beta 7